MVKNVTKEVTFNNSICSMCLEYLPHIWCQHLCKTCTVVINIPVPFGASEQLKKHRLFRVYKGWNYSIQLYRDYHNKPLYLRIPNKQPVIHGKYPGPRFFFSWLNPGESHPPVSSSVSPRNVPLSRLSLNSLAQPPLLREASSPPIFGSRRGWVGENLPLTPPWVH